MYDLVFCMLMCIEGGDMNSLRDQLKDEMVEFLLQSRSHDDGSLVLWEDGIRELVPDMLDVIFVTLGIEPVVQDMLHSSAGSMVGLRKWLYSEIDRVEKEIDEGGLFYELDTEKDAYENVLKEIDGEGANNEERGPD